jgi:hypothetical protein
MRLAPTLLALAASLALSTAAVAACPDDLDTDAKRACLEAELQQLDQPAAAAAEGQKRPALQSLGGRSYSMDGEVVRWKDIQPTLELDPRASKVATRATRLKRTSIVLGLASGASIAAGIAMFSQGGVGSGNGGSGVRAAGAAVGGLGGTGLLVSSLVVNGQARKARQESIGVYNVGVSLQDEGGALRFAGRF